MIPLPANLRSVTEVAISEYGEKNLQVVQNLILSENFCRTTAKEKKPSFSRQSSCPNHTYGGFDKIKAAVPYALDKGVTPIR